MTLDGAQSQREEISRPKMGILKWPLTGTKVVMTKEVAAIAQAVDDDDPPSNE